MKDMGSLKLVNVSKVFSWNIELGKSFLAGKILEETQFNRDWKEAKGTRKKLESAEDLKSINP